MANRSCQMRIFHFSLAPKDQSRRGIENTWRYIQLADVDNRQNDFDTCRIKFDCVYSKLICTDQFPERRLLNASTESLSRNGIGIPTSTAPSAHSAHESAQRHPLERVATE